MLRKLPRRADRISAALAEGRFTISLRLFSDPRDASMVTSLVNRAVLGLLGSALGVMSVILLLAPGSPGVSRGITLLYLFGYVGLFLSVTLILRVVLEILSPRRRHLPFGMIRKIFRTEGSASRLASSLLGWGGDVPMPTEDRLRWVAGRSAYPSCGHADRPRRHRTIRSNRRPGAGPAGSFLSCDACSLRHAPAFMCVDTTSTSRRKGRTSCRTLSLNRSRRRTPPS
jgi:hypothetical protein